jgi:hypothetical protein
LPHAIIVVNATDIDAEEQEWDTRYCTERLISAVSNAIYEVPAIRSLAHTWRARGRTINTVWDLIHCYYRSFTVIKIPREGRPSLLLRQINNLKSLISSQCEESDRAKRQARMRLNSDDLGTFIQAAFDHFSTTLDAPFNFVDASLKTNPIPKNIGGNILQLAISMMQRYPMNGKGNFTRLSKVAASCVILDCIRYRLGK